MVETAEEWNISYSLDPSPHPGGTDAYAIQVTQAVYQLSCCLSPQVYAYTY